MTRIAVFLLLVVLDGIDQRFDALDGFGGARTKGGEIAEQPGDVRAAQRFQVGESGFESGQVAVNIREHCQTHRGYFSFIMCGSAQIVTHGGQCAMRLMGVACQRQRHATSSGIAP